MNEVQVYLSSNRSNKNNKFYSSSKACSLEAEYGNMLRSIGPNLLPSKDKCFRLIKFAKAFLPIFSIPLLDMVRYSNETGPPSNQSSPSSVMVLYDKSNSLRLTRWLVCNFAGTLSSVKLEIIESSCKINMIIKLQSYKEVQSNQRNLFQWRPFSFQNFFFFLKISNNNFLITRSESYFSQFPCKLK